MTVKPSHMVQVVVLFVQYLVLLGTLPIPWGQASVVLGLFRASDTTFAAFGSHIGSLSCILSSLSLEERTGIPLAILRQLVTLFAPLVLFILAVLLDTLFWWVMQCSCCWRWQRRPQQTSANKAIRCWRELQQKLPVMVLVVVFFSFPFLVRMALGFFACIRLDSANLQTDPYPQYAQAFASHGYWINDMSQACYEGWHLRWAIAMGVPCVAVLCLGIPAAIVLWLYSHDPQLSDVKFKAKYGFLYNNFRPRMYCFEAVRALQTVFVVSISAFRYTLQPFYATLCMNQAFALSCVLQLGCRPFASRLLHFMQLMGLACLYCITTLALTVFTVDVSSGSAYQQFVGALVLAVSIAYMCWCVGTVAWESKHLWMKVWYLLPCSKKPKPVQAGGPGESIPTAKDAKPASTSTASV